MLPRYLRYWRQIIIGLCCTLAGVALVGMMALTMADVILRGLFNTPIRGSFEIIELLLAWTFFVALPATFLLDDHIVVDLIDGMMPKAVPALKRLGEIVAIAVIALMAWQGWTSAKDTLLFNDVTPDLEIPRILYWVPVLIGLVGSGIAALAQAVRPREQK